MAETTATPARKPRAPKVAPPVAPAIPEAAEGNAAKAKFAKALDEAKAGAQALGTQVQDTAGAYREKLAGQSEALIDEAKAAAAQAKEKAAALAQDGKARAVEGISAVSKIVADNAGAIDEKLGPKFGDYARSAARTLDGAATKLEAKDLGELGEDAREFVRKSPGLAIGIAATAGFLLSRLFRGSPKAED